MTPPVVLTIAGSDSGGGAGIQADLKTFLAVGVHGASALTAITAQNTVGVKGVQVLPTQFVRAQIDAVLEDFRLSATKTGMLATREIVETVAEYARRGTFPNLVVDPVMVAASGDRLLDPAAEDAYKEALFPWATVVTPNLREASVLVGRELARVEDMVSAAREISSWGPQIVVVKGGHLDYPEATDVVVSKSGVEKLLRGERIETRNVHGTGCTFASATAAYMALGRQPLEAVELAKRFVSEALRSAASWSLGKGRGPVDHLAGAKRGALGSLANCQEA